MQQQILQSLHDNPAGGCHFGRDKTRDKVSSRLHAVKARVYYNLLLGQRTPGRRSNVRARDRAPYKQYYSNVINRSVAR